ncbi:AAA family ATPase [Roseomonas marmotae]|uniref:non-specific protein-tyrosine kinase n=1 Tax=Roseomonas marmotae TaxID=2768161 RepID=A0ABS3KH86_9PROT|nr:AAA family ATPase [Roseomonas marmotae]MBO1076782.1 AAA family ATPase [Roseomonas marmotae]QTI78691.1 AAA family ATPase [Roseomonas marmotae]
MNMPFRGRAHLVERAVEAMGDSQSHVLSAPPAGQAEAASATGLPPAGPAPAPAATPGLVKPVISLDLMIAAGLVPAPPGRQRNRVVEEVSVVQQQVLRAAEDGSARNRIVLVTSARPGEGKTFMALNLAACMAANGTRKVVLIDTDGKRGSITEALKVGDADGLRGLVAGPQGQVGLPLVQTAIRNLMFLPFGRAVVAAQQVPPANLMADAIARIARLLPDHVLVLDTPPSLSSSDANALSSVAGQVLMVVDAERTQRNEVEAALDMIDACPLLQLVLNRVSMSANDRFGAYGDYGAPPDAN